MESLNCVAVPSSVLSIDPGMVNFGWCIYCVREGTLESVLQYGVMHVCDVSPSTIDIDKALDKIKKELIQPYRPLYQSVCFETQPYISYNCSQNGRTANFRMQQLEMGMRGLLKGLDIPYTAIDPKSVKAFWKIGTGDYNSNKKVVVDFAKDAGFIFKELPYAKQHHVCDCFAQARYLLSKTGVLKLPDDNSKCQQSYRTLGERRKKHPSHTINFSPPSPETGSGTSDSQEDSPRSQ